MDGYPSLRYALFVTRKTQSEKAKERLPRLFAAPAKEATPLTGGDYRAAFSTTRHQGTHRKKDWYVLRHTMAKWPAPEIVDLLLTLDKPDQVLFFRLLPRHLSEEVFSYLEPDEQNALLKRAYE